MPCRECAREISSEAATCPHCGIANPAGKAKVPEGAVTPSLKGLRRPAKSDGLFLPKTIWRLLVFVLGVVALLKFGPFIMDLWGTVGGRAEGTVTFGDSVDESGAFRVIGPRAIFDQDVVSIAYVARLNRAVGARSLDRVLSRVSANGGERVIDQTTIPVANPDFTEIADRLEMRSGGLLSLLSSLLGAEQDTGLYRMRFVVGEKVLAIGEFTIAPRSTRKRHVSAPPAEPTSQERSVASRRSGVREEPEGASSDTQNSRSGTSGGMVVQGTQNQGDGGMARPDSVMTFTAPADPVYFDSQVDKPVGAAEGNPAPVYPAVLRAGNMEGQVLASFVVDTTGHADMSTLVVIKTTHDLFSQAVKVNLPKMKFIPAERDGRKVKQRVQQQFLFTLNKCCPIDKPALL